MDILPGFSTQTPHLATTADSDFYTSDFLISRHRVYERGATLARQALLEASIKRAQQVAQDLEHRAEQAQRRAQQVAGATDE